MQIHITPSTFLFLSLIHNFYFLMSPVHAKTGANLHTGPSEIVAALQSLGPHKFCARSPTDLHFNVLALQLEENSGNAGSTNLRPLVFLTSYGDLTEERRTPGTMTTQKRLLSFDQCFILQRPERGTGGNEPNR